ncbi:MAG: hypothetical protein ACRD0Z_06480 [Acidimicrobiales bacterium]
MVLLLRAELLKLSRSRGVWVVTGMAVAFMVFVQWHSQGVSYQFATGIEEYRRLLGMPCTTGSPGHAVACTAKQADAYRAALSGQIVDDERAARAGWLGISPLGELVFTLGMFATAVGVGVAMSLGSIAVDTELRSGGLKASIIQQQRRGRVVAGKLGGAYAVTLGAILVCAVCSVATGRLLQAIRPLPAPSGAPWSGAALPAWGWTIAAGLLTPAVMIAVTVAGGLLVRSTLGAVGGAGAFVLLDRAFVALQPHLAYAGFTGAVGVVTRSLVSSELTQSNFTVVLWPSSLGNGGAAPLATLELVAMAAAAGLLALGALHWREIR